MPTMARAPTTFARSRGHGPGGIQMAGKRASQPTVAVHVGGEQDMLWRGRDGDFRDGWHR